MPTAATPNKHPNNSQAATDTVDAEEQARRSAVYAAIAAIPPGQVAAYGEVAKMAGLPGRARWVGRLLSQLPAQSQLPWYRVVRADGKLGFAEGSENFERQRKALAKEGVPISNSRIAKRLFYRASHSS